jgi:glutathione S-transferase
MATLTHYRLCPRSRSVRAALAEIGIGVDLVEERPWEWRPDFLALNPAGELPVLALDEGVVLCGAYAISEYLSEEFKSHPKDGRAVPLFPGSAAERAEVRRLVDWFHGKLNREVTRELLHEKVFARLLATAAHPDPDMLRAIRANLRYHMSYVNHLAHERHWLAGETMSFADFAAAAHISCADYLGEMPWEEFPIAKSWYARIKSRPAFRPILADRVPGPPPPQAYSNPDF